jgi:hypothetical protein
MPGYRRTKSAAELDRLRLAHGNEQFAGIFRGLCGKDRAYAARLLNDGRLQFPSFFLLHKDIDELGLAGELSEGRRMAHELDGALASPVQDEPWKRRPEHVTALQWMLRTGAREEGMGWQYDAVMDRAAALLAREHGDRQCLPIIAGMAFARRRGGQYAGDAEWALFESGDPACLGLVAARLSSRNASDIEQARRMLNFIPCIGENAGNPALQRRRASRWIARNRPRLRYTGLGSQQGPNPVRFEIVDEAPPPSQPRRASRALSRKGMGT